MLKSEPAKVMVFLGGMVGRCLSHEVGTLRNGIILYTRGSREIPSPYPLVVRIQQEVHSLEEAAHSITLALQSATLQNWEKYIPTVYKLPICGVFLHLPKQTKTFRLCAHLHDCWVL